MNKQKFQRGEIYHIYWYDTYSFNGWFSEDDAVDNEFETDFISAIGYFVAETKDWYIIAKHKNPNARFGFKKWGDISYIPKGCVVKITIIKTKSIKT